MAVAKHKTPDLGRVYRHHVIADMPTAWDFRVLRIRRGTRRHLDLTAYTDSISWTDEGQFSTGTLSLNKPDPDSSWQILARGDAIRLDVHYRSGWRVLWQMGLDGFPETTTADGILSVSVKDDLSRLTRQRRDWRFRHTKSRKRGYYPGEIARAVAKREGLRVGHILRGSHRIDKLEKKHTTALDIIVTAYAREREHTGLAYTVRIRNGRLEIFHADRSPSAYVFRDSIEAMTVSREGKTNPFTALVGKARIGKGKKARKIKFRLAHKDLIRKLGLNETERNYGTLKSAQVLRRKVKADYADEVKVVKAGNMTVTGLPFLVGATGVGPRIGQGIQILVPAEGMKGKGSWFWTTAVSHNIDGGAYTTDVSFTDEDPWLKLKDAEDAKRRAIKRTKRKKAKKK